MEGEGFPEDWVECLSPDEAAFIKLIDEHAHELQTVKDVLTAALNALDTQSSAIHNIEALVESILVEMIERD
jgi:hypothetical protein